MAPRKYGNKTTKATLRKDLADLVLLVESCKTPRDKRSLRNELRRRLHRIRRGLVEDYPGMETHQDDTNVRRKLERGMLDDALKDFIMRQFRALPNTLDRAGRQERMGWHNFTFEWDISAHEPLRVITKYEWDGRVISPDWDPTDSKTLFDPPAFTNQAP